MVQPASSRPRRRRRVALQATPPTVAQPRGVPAILGKDVLATGRSSASQSQRMRFGRAISLEKIEYALIAAQSGNMTQLTDLSRETVDTDPHLASVLNKRLGAVSSLPWEVVPATGYGIDRARAAFYAEVVREQLRGLNEFRQSLYQLAWALFDGRAALEKVWVDIPPARQMRDSQFGAVRWAIGALPWIHPRRLVFGPSRELRVVDEQARAPMGAFAKVGFAVDPVFEPDSAHKFVWWMPQMFGEYPEREGLAARCLYYSFFKRFAARERMILTELFGKPWRIIKVPEDWQGGADELEKADEVIDQLGGHATARLPPGVDLDIKAPGRSAGAVHGEVIAESDKQLSKLVLGQTGTTDANPSGLNNIQADVMQNEQLMILMFDANRIAERVETLLCDDIIALNFGWDAVSHAPRFSLRSDRPVDRKSEVARLQAALEAGLAIDLSEAYEVSGFRLPTDEDVVLRIEQPPVPPLAPVPPAPRPVVVYPPGQSPTAGEQQPPPPIASSEEGSADPSAQVSAPDAKITVTVNEDRAARGLGPLLMPDGSPDPEGELPIAEFEARRAAEAAPEPDEQGEGPSPTQPQVASVDLSARGLGDELAVALAAATVARQRDRAAMRRLVSTGCAHCTDAEQVQCVSAHRQPSTANGSPETILDRAMPGSRSAMRKLAEHFKAAVAGKSSAAEIYGALNAARARLDGRPLARELERRMVQSLQLGVIDSDYEVGESVRQADEATQPLPSARADGQVEASTRVVAAEPPPDFSKMRFDDAAKRFAAKGVLPRDAFDRLSARAKLRAFTVSGVVGDQALHVLQDDLAREVATGGELRDFSKRVDSRLREAGFLAQMTELPAGGQALQASHVETVFRTNVLNAYNAGRAEHQKQPETLARRPVWEWRSVRAPQDPKTGRGTRPTHAAAHGVRVLATDPIWQTIYPPAGYSCRCRVVTLGRDAVDSAVPGSSAFRNLPDPGFKAGQAALLA